MSGIVPLLTKPVTGIPLLDIAEGSICKVNENGSPVEFYVAKHNYESALNGTGRTLLVRKDCYDIRQWHSSAVAAYASSTIDSWLNSTYKNLLDADIREIIGTTKIKYTPGNGSYGVSTLERAIFLLSAVELGMPNVYWYNAEGSALDTASSLQVAQANGTTVFQWTRSPDLDDDDDSKAVYLKDTGSCDSISVTEGRWSRPAFTLPSNTEVDETTLILKGAT